MYLYNHFDMAQDKVCSKCTTNKSVEDFSCDASRADGRNVYCKPCKKQITINYKSAPGYRVRLNKSNREWQKKHPSRKKAYGRKANLKSKGLTIDAWHVMLGEQYGLCKICHTINDGSILNVDHDHLTGRVRGLLCDRCNLGLGQFFDSPIRLQSAIAYLNEIHNA